MERLRSGSRDARLGRPTRRPTRARFRPRFRSCLRPADALPCRRRRASGGIDSARLFPPRMRKARERSRDGALGVAPCSATTSAAFRPARLGDSPGASPLRLRSRPARRACLDPRRGVRCRGVGTRLDGRRSHPAYLTRSLDPKGHGLSLTSRSGRRCGGSAEPPDRAVHGVAERLFPRVVEHVVVHVVHHVGEAEP
jgi:hypothetical protein